MTVETQVQSNPSVKLSFRNLGKTFFVQDEPKLALQNIHAEIRTGEFVSIVGASGCGKSTLIRIAAGLEQATEGGVYVEDNLVIKPGQDRGMVFQQFPLFPWCGKENVMFGLQIGICKRFNARKRRWFGWNSRSRRVVSLT